MDSQKYISPYNSKRKFKLLRLQGNYVTQDTFDNKDRATFKPKQKQQRTLYLQKIVNDNSTFTNSEQQLPNLETTYNTIDQSSAYNASTTIRKQEQDSESIFDINPYETTKFNSFLSKAHSQNYLSSGSKVYKRRVCGTLDNYNSILYKKQQSNTIQQVKDRKSTEDQMKNKYYQQFNIKNILKKNINQETSNKTKQSQNNAKNKQIDIKSLRKQTINKLKQESLNEDPFTIQINDYKKDRQSLPYGQYEPEVKDTRSLMRYQKYQDIWDTQKMNRATSLIKQKLTKIRKMSSSESLINKSDNYYVKKQDIDIIDRVTRGERKVIPEQVWYESLRVYTDGQNLNDSKDDNGYYVQLESNKDLYAKVNKLNINQKNNLSNNSMIYAKSLSETIHNNSQIKSMTTLGNNSKLSMQSATPIKINQYLERKKQQNYEQYKQYLNGNDSIESLKQLKIRGNNNSKLQFNESDTTKDFKFNTLDIQAQ